MSDRRRLYFSLFLHLTTLTVFGSMPFAFSAVNSNDQSLFEMSLEELLDLKVVSVMRREERISESPSAIQVITNEQIRMAGATSLPEALRLATNLQVAQQNSQEWIITARGFSTDVGNKLLVLIDGRTVYTPLFSGVFWGRQDYLLEDIERIEVISGPGGTVWGANAVNGVINIITKDASNTEGLYMEARAGTQLEQQVGLRYGAQLSDATSWRTYGKFTERDNEYLSDGSTGSDAWQMAQIGFRLDSTHSEATSFTLQGDYYDNEVEVSATDRAETSGANILGRWIHKLQEDSEYQLQIYYDKTSMSLPTLPLIINSMELAPAGVFEDELETVDVDFQYQFMLGEAHNVMWGLAYRYSDDKTRNSPGLGFFPEHSKQHLYSAFVQDEISILPDELSFIIGTKLEKNDYTGTEWEPGIRLQWNYTHNKMLWSAISRAVRMPSRLDREISQATPPYFVLLTGGADFQSENVTAYELGWRGQLSKNFTTSLSTYYNEYTDLRSTNFTPDTIVPFFFENNLEGETWGLELNTSFQATNWWRLRVGYNFMEQDLRVKEGEFDFNNAQNETADPKHQFSFRSSIAYKHFEFNLGLRWVDKLPTNNAGELVFVDSYSEMDMRIAWRINDNVDLSLVGKNLLKDHHQEFGVPSPQQQEVGRSIFLNCQLRF